MRRLMDVFGRLMFAVYVVLVVVFFDWFARYNLLHIFGVDAVATWAGLHLALKVFIALCLCLVVFPLTVVVFVLSQFIKTPFF